MLLREAFDEFRWYTLREAAEAAGLPVAFVSWLYRRGGLRYRLYRREPLVPAAEVERLRTMATKTGGDVFEKPEGTGAFVL